MVRPHVPLWAISVVLFAACTPSDAPPGAASPCPETQAPECSASIYPLEGRGQEPGWHINISLDSIVLIQELGTRRTSVPVEGVRPGTLRTDLTGQIRDTHLAVAILRTLCRDIMSGMPHPFALEVVINQETTLSGCAGNPSTLLRPGTEWEVVRLGSDAETVQPRPTVLFDFGEGRVSGRASCNRYHAAFELTGEGLTLSSPLATTRMACPEPSAAQEARFLSALSDLRGFDITSEGLVLITGDAQLTLTPIADTPP